MGVVGCFGQIETLIDNPYLNMAIYIVTYDLRNECTSDSYTRLVSLIKEEGVWACLGGSSYLVESELTPVALRDKYKQAINHDDKLFVGVVSAPAAWVGYSSQVSDWIKQKM